MNKRDKELLIERGPNRLERQLQAISDRIEKQRKDKSDQLRAGGYSEDVVAKIEAENVEILNDAKAAVQNGSLAVRHGNKRRGGTTATRLIEQAQLKLFDLERRGDFTQFPITPGSEYPTIFTRIPIFGPNKRSTALKKLDRDLAMRFHTGWGEGRKFGPPLNIYDEDTLLALGGLRQRQLTGMGSKMPVKVMNPFDPFLETSVDVLYTTIGEIEEFLDNKKGGRGQKRRLASVKRLAAVTIEFSRISDPNINSIIKKQSFNTKIIDMLTEEMTGDSCLYIQFTPVMVKWLRESYTYIDMKIRNKLTDNGKAIHKYLSGQPTFNLSAVKLHELTDSHLKLNKFYAALRQTLEKLEELGWLEYDLRGNGRTKPYILTGRRLDKAKTSNDG